MSSGWSTSAESRACPSRSATRSAAPSSPRSWTTWACHTLPRSDTLPGARPGGFDAWTLGMGYIAAMRILDDVERFTRP